MQGQSLLSLLNIMDGGSHGWVAAVRCRKRKKGRAARADEADKENATATGSAACSAGDRHAAALEEFDGSNGDDPACVVHCCTSVIAKHQKIPVRIRAWTSPFACASLEQLLRRSGRAGDSLKQIARERPLSFRCH
jgi:hypothetical protein